MPTHNIKSIQNLEDLKYISQLGDQQQIQALANLGQRMGVKGDSVAYGSFTFMDILENNYIPNSENLPEIGILNYYLHPGKNCIFSEVGTTTTEEKYVHSKRPLNNLVVNSNEENVFYQQFFLNNFELETKVNNIEYYNANSIFNKDGNILKTLLFGKILGTEATDPNNIEIQYNEFDLKHNVLNRAIRTYYAYSLNNNEHYYILLDFTKCHDNEGTHDYKDYYDVSIYILNSKDVKEELNIDITKLYNLEDIDTNEEFVNVAEKYVNILNKKYFNEYCLFNLFSKPYAAKYKNIELEYDVEENKLIFNESNEKLKYVESILVNTSEISIYNRINYINVDITYLYPQIFAYYDFHSYKANKGVLYKHILFSLYEKLLSEYGIDNSYIDEFPVMYIPLNQKIYYMHNKENEFIVYYVKDIHVNKVDFSIYTPSKIKEILNTDTILLDYSCVKENDIAKTYDNKQTVYQINFDYNEKYQILINNIDVLNLYTLPYINARNNWVVNDLDTNVVAKAAVTNDQTLLLVYNEYNSDKYVCKLLSNVNNNEIFESSLNHNEIKEINLSYDRILNCYLPKLTEENYAYFKDILLVLISDSSCITEGGVHRQSDDNKFCTFWQTHIDDNDNMSFEILMFNENKILDAKDIFNFDELKEWVMSNIDMENNVFDKIYLGIKQTQNWNQSVNKSLGYKGMITFIDPNETLNLLKMLYEDTLSYEDYFNCLSVLCGVYETKVKEDYTNSTQFINSTSANNIIKTLYVGDKEVQYDEDTVIPESQYVDRIISLFSDSGTVEYEINSDRIRNYKLADYIEREYTDIYTIREKIEKINEGINETSHDFYQEYDFNSNVPEIDLKEFISKNINILNRMNIVSLDKDGNLYNAFLGTDFNNENKNELILTSNKTNINMGQNTLINKNASNSFFTHDAFRMIFDKIIFDSKHIQFETNVQLFEHPSTSVYADENNTPHTIHVESLIDSLNEYYVYENNDNMSHLLIYENSEYNSLLEFENVKSSERLSKLFYNFILKREEQDGMKYKQIIFSEEYENGWKAIETEEYENGAQTNKVIINWSYILRKYGVLDKNTKIGKLWYNNVECSPYNVELDVNKVYTNTIWKERTDNPNILTVVDSKDFILLSNDSLFKEQNTVIINRGVNITYWYKNVDENNKLAYICINDGGLNDDSETIKYVIKTATLSGTTE